MNEITWLRSHVERCLEDHWEVFPLVVDNDGDYPFVCGTAHCFVEVSNGDQHFIRVWAFVARVPRRTLKLLAELNEINELSRTVRVFWNGHSVIAEQTLYAGGLNKETLGQACDAVGATANALGVLLVAMFGGETPFPALDAEDQQEESR